MFFQIGVPKNFAIFTGKHLCWSLFLIKLQAFRSITLLQIDSNTGFFPVKFANFLRTLCFTEHIRWLHLSVMISVTAYILLTCIANFFLLAQNFAMTQFLSCLIREKAFFLMIRLRLNRSPTNLRFFSKINA